MCIQFLVPTFKIIEEIRLACVRGAESLYNTMLLGGFTEVRLNCVPILEQKRYTRQ